MPLSRALSLCLVVLTCASGAAAQDARPGMEPGGPDAAHGGWDPAVMRRHMEAGRAEHLKALHDVLGIQPSQEAAFTAFATAMSPPEGGRDGERDGDGREGAGERADRPASLTTPERLDRMRARMDRKMAKMREAFDRRAQATKALYAVLDPRQRAAMDALPELTGHGGRKGGMHHMGRSGPMGAGM